MNDVIWAELDALSNLKPFTKENTMGHIAENPAVWNQLFDHKHVAFADLPNRNFIDIKGFFDRDFSPNSALKAIKSKKKSMQQPSIMMPSTSGPT